MIKKKLKCRDEDYELLKDARWRFNSAAKRINQLESEILELSREKGTELSVQLRESEIKSLKQRKEFLNKLLKELETNCFGEEVEE